MKQTYLGLFCDINFFELLRTTWNRSKNSDSPDWHPSSSYVWLNNTTFLVIKIWMC